MQPSKSTAILNALPNALLLNIHRQRSLLLNVHLINTIERSLNVETFFFCQNKVQSLKRGIIVVLLVHK